MKIFILFILMVSASLCYGQHKDVTYKVVHTEFDNTGLATGFDVYVTDIKYIKAINKTLFAKYKNTRVVTLQIYYYDNLAIALKYRKASFNKTISDQSLNKMAQHVVGVFVYNPFIKPSEELKIGKDAENL